MSLIASALRATAGQFLNPVFKSGVAPGLVALTELTIGAVAGYYILPSLWNALAGGNSVTTSIKTGSAVIGATAGYLHGVNGIAPLARGLGASEKLQLARARFFNAKAAEIEADLAQLAAAPAAHGVPAGAAAAPARAPARAVDRLKTGVAAAAHTLWTYKVSLLSAAAIGAVTYAIVQPMGQQCFDEITHRIGLAKDQLAKGGLDSIQERAVNSTISEYERLFGHYSDAIDTFKPCPYPNSPILSCDYQRTVGRAYYSLKDAVVQHLSPFLSKGSA